MIYFHYLKSLEVQQLCKNIAPVFEPFINVNVGGE